MRRHRFSVVTVVGLALLVISGQDSAAATRCGKRTPDGEVAKASLTLSTDSVVHHTFKRSTGTADLSLIFLVAGCELRAPLTPKPTLKLRPLKDVADLPEDAVSLTAEDLDGAELTVELEVDAAEFEPGTYGRLVSLRAPTYLASNRTAITASRSEDREWLPVLVGLGGALVGFGLLFARTLITEGSNVSRRTVIAAIAIIVGGVVAAFPLYWNQEVWTIDDNGWATAGAAFAAASAGSLAALLPTTPPQSERQTDAKPPPAIS